MVPISEKSKAPTQKEPIAISGLAFLANFPDAIGSYSFGIEFIGPGNVTLLKSGEGKLASQNTGLNVVTGLRPFPIVSFGMHKLIIKLNNKPYLCAFEVRRGVLNSAHPQPAIVLEQIKRKQNVTQKK